jgi:glycosyltransferase involved in cell wall biosynthesis
MHGRKKLLILSRSDLSRDPRVNRQIRCLRDFYSIVCSGTGHPRLDSVDFIELPRKERLPVARRAVRVMKLLARRYAGLYWEIPWVRRALESLRSVNPDGILANDIDVLPLALELAGGAPVIYDAHEYSPRQSEERLRFRLLSMGFRAYVCRKYIPRVAAMMTVSEGISEHYFQDTGVRPEVVLNLPDYEDVTPQDRERGVVRLIHHGGSNRSRQLERLVRTVDHLNDRFELYFMLVEMSPGYLNGLKQLAARRRRIHFLAPVAMDQIVRTINRFDLGVHLLPPVNFNQKHALPNKLFEFIQARLGVAIGPSPEMAKLVGRHELGVVASDFSPESLAHVLNRLGPDDIQRYKSNADRVARQYSAGTTRQALLAVVNEALA